MSDLVTYLRHVFVDQFDVWVALGFVAQLMFTGRFVVQWLASERARRSVIPVAFWIFSLAGGALLLVYAIQRRDPVFILGQAAGLFVYTRNLVLIWGERKRASAEFDLAAP
ncbi:MAG TPA: hypothetical protein ENH55_19410 [Aurantimonas coralicida]|uniref:Lipid A biosynthesis N-terminal domain-containing protein n=2 Tax=root TaxID=1 RepID=A0A9C9NKL1_9HYPH|nr:hypothetical protein [Aurantimonas coralicida]HEU03025.1 hypothetical protein [Aurantimonas coralicida]